MSLLWLPNNFKGSWDTQLLWGACKFPSHGTLMDTCNKVIKKHVQDNSKQTAENDDESVNLKLANHLLRGRSACPAAVSSVGAAGVNTMGFPPNSASTLRGSYGRCKRPGSSRVLSPVCFGCAGSQKSSVLRSPNAILRRVARNAGCLDGGVVLLWRRVHFRSGRSLSVAGARETLWSGPTPTFHDRRRRLERFCVNVQISWQAQYFGHGGGLRRALISWQVQ